MLRDLLVKCQEKNGGCRHVRTLNTMKKTPPSRVVRVSLLLPVCVTPFHCYTTLSTCLQDLVYWMSRQFIVYGMLWGWLKIMFGNGS